jgi:hypothetical protein
VSSANIITSANELICKRKSLLYMLKRRGPSSKPQRTPCLAISQIEQKFSVFEDFVSTFCFLLYKYDLNQIKISPCIPQYFSLNRKGS